LYLDAVRKIESRVYAAIGKEKKLPTPTLTPFPDQHVGSRLCPTRVAVKIAILKLYKDIEESNHAQDTVKAHNLNTLLTLWHFSFATACRAIDTPYLSFAEIDADTGIAFLTDKDDGTGYKARLAWLPPAVLQRMTRYDLERADLLPQLSHEAENKLPIFFLEKSRTGQLKLMRVRPASLEPIMQPYLPYPANFHRRFVRSELLSRGCPVEVVDAYMGHWSTGEEPWAVFSSFSFEEYRQQLEAHLVPLMQEIGLVR
jgi:integrase